MSRRLLFSLEAPDFPASGEVTLSLGYGGEWQPLVLADARRGMSACHDLPDDVATFDVSLIVKAPAYSRIAVYLIVAGERRGPVVQCLVNAGNAWLSVRTRGTVNLQP